MENYNSFIELLKRFDIGRSFERVDEWGNEIDENGNIIDTFSYNGFPCDRFEDIEVYENHLNDLFKIAFIDIKKAVDGLLINSNNPSLLDIFFKSKIDDLNELEKIIEKRNDEVTEKKIDNSFLYHEAKKNFEEDGGGDDVDTAKSIIEMFEDFWMWKRYEELYYRGNMDMFELAEKVPLIDRYRVRRIVPIIMEKGQRDMIKSTKDRMGELYGIYCPKQNEVKEEKQSKTTNHQVEKDFKSYLHHDNKDALVDKLHELLDGKKGKVVAITIKALEQLGFISVSDSRSAIYKTMRVEFGKIGSDQSINPIMNNSKQYSLEIEQQVKILKEVK